LPAVLLWAPPPPATPNMLADMFVTVQ
jgi:hypothetical protein